MSDLLITFFDKGIKATEREQGIVISIKVTANAKKDQVLKDDEYGLHVKVTTLAESNRANKAIIKILSKKLGISKSKLVLVKGEKSRFKDILLCYNDLSVSKIKFLQEKIKCLF